MRIALVLAVVSVSAGAVLSSQVSERLSLIRLKAAGQIEDIDWRHMVGPPVAAT